MDGWEGGWVGVWMGWLVCGYYSENNATLWPIMQSETCQILAKVRFQDKAECDNNQVCIRLTFYLMFMGDK